jgi:S-adenosylmethionine synthetase
MLDLLRPIYKATAAYGHFGREKENFPWEKTDKLELLRAALLTHEMKQVTEF